MSFWRVIKEQIQRRPEIIKQSAAEVVGMFAVLWFLNKTGIVEPDTRHEKSFKELHQLLNTPQQDSEAGPQEQH